MAESVNANGFLLWLNQIRNYLSSNKFPPNQDLYLGLIDQEDAWRNIFLSTQQGKDIYKKFVDYILNERKNILDARPFFRLRQADFLNKVNPFIKEQNYEALFPLRANFTFINWAMPQYHCEHKQQLEVINRKIMQIRNDFLLRNSPLIINRIKIIYHVYPFIYKDIQDLISIASNATLIALDKFVPLIDEETGQNKYTSVLLSSIIGRINASVFQYNINQKLHMYPKDRKLLSELRKMKNGGYLDDEIAVIMNISESEIERLFNSNQVLTLEEGYNVHADDSYRPDASCEKTEIMKSLQKNIDALSILERKMLYLKGML